MIRRISANNDYRDIVRSCPSGVINDIYAIEYYVKGYDGVYSAAFSKTGSLLEVIIPSSALKTLHSGVLMRRAKYRNEDPSFPDGNYDLEFVEDMNVWLDNGSVEPGPGPVPGEYLTADDLKTINNESLVGEGNIQIDHGVPEQTFTDHVIGNIQAFSALDNRVTALEQGGGGGGVSQEQFDAHMAQNDAQFSGIDQSLNDLNQLVQKAQSDAGDAARQAAQAHQRALQAIQKNDAQDDRMNAIDAKNSDQDARMDAIEMKNSDQDARMDNAEAHFKAVEDITDKLSDAVNGLDQRVTGLENAGFATSQDLDAVAQHIQDVDNKADDIQNQVDGLDKRVSDLEGQNNVQYNIGSPLYDGYNKVITTFEPGNSYCPLLILTNDEGGEGAQYDGIRIDNSGIYKYSANNYEVPGTWSETAEELATQTWVQNQGYASDTDLDSLESRVSVLEHGGSPVSLVWGGISGTITDQTDLVSYIGNQGFLTSSDLSGYATESWVQNQGYLTQHQDLTGYATETWVQNQGYLTSSSTLPADQITCNISGDVFDFENVDAGLTALVSRVEDQMDNITSLDNRVTGIENAGYATQTWVGQQGYITSSALSGYATRTWVQGQGYATQTWATNQFLEESKVWTGTETQWNQLSAEEKASYTIALITQ